MRGCLGRVNQPETVIRRVIRQLADDGQIVGAGLRQRERPDIGIRITVDENNPAARIEQLNPNIVPIIFQRVVIKPLAVRAAEAVDVRAERRTQRLAVSTCSCPTPAGNTARHHSCR